VELLAGTSGYSYPEWRGGFYPDGFAASEMLRHYGERLPAVEINNTFYRLPRASVLESWAAAVPESFRFSLKASRRITHFKRLKDAGDETSYLLRTAATLGSRLGALLFQLPPNLPLDLERLDRFLELLPADTPAVFEFRHASWFDDAVTSRLQARGAVLCLADRGVDGEVETPIVATARFGYLRLRREQYARADLSEWAARIQAQPWERAFVFFAHEAHGPALAADLLEITARMAERRGPIPVRPTREKREAG
jgi:uncharacterized protein YecE (DUF72 family)